MNRRREKTVEDGRRRVVIEGVSPEIDCGRFAAKRVVGDDVVVEADAFTDGHDGIRCLLLHRREEAEKWAVAEMEPLGNDRWRGSFPVLELGRYRYAIMAWIDHFTTWRADMFKRVDAGQDVAIELRIGAAHVRAAADRASAGDAAELRDVADALDAGAAGAVDVALSDETHALMRRWPDRRFATTYDPGLAVVVDPELARFGAWYELFPRSAGTGMEHGTFEDVERALPRLAGLGFDVLYFPPIHPIGETERKGPNNALASGADDAGSPWAIGAAEGGHKSILPALGDAKGFRRLVRLAREEYGIEVALDIAFQASPDHPYVEEHEEWFRKRPDGTIQYAENPPKKYQDIYPFDFDSEAWQPLWHELKSVFDHWLDQGVRIFRVDNPHTKPFAFWQWCISEIKQTHPDAIFLSEAFTRPKVMYRLAKLGFTQSYTYFAWRNAKWEIEEYLTELTRTSVADFFRPNFWPNTPDILTEYLQTGGRPAFMIRLVLAATLCSNYGIYGPAFELLEHAPREPGSEEYLDSEKYQIRDWDLERSGNLSEVIARLNRIRRDNRALQRNDSLRFHPIDNDRLIAYSKSTPNGETILTIVNLDPHHTHAALVHLDLEAIGVAPDERFQVHDLLGEGRYDWQGPTNYVQLDPHVLPAHVFRIRRRLRSERDFEYFV